MKTILLSVLVIFSFCALPNAYKRLTHGFRPEKCCLHWPSNPEWESSPLPVAKEQQIQAILERPFSYFAKGKQCFVFSSQDDAYVLKLFRFDACKIPYGQKIVHCLKKWKRGNFDAPPPLATEVPKVLNSCKMSYEYASDLTGLVYIHLNPKKKFFPILQIKDRLGRMHKIDPAKYRFILQKKCAPFMPTLINANAVERDQFLTSFSNLLEYLGNAGLKNLDPRLSCNFGFLQGQAIAIDVGNYIYEPSLAKKDKVIFTTRLNRCLAKKLSDITNHGDYALKNAEHSK